MPKTAQRSAAPPVSQRDRVVRPRPGGGCRLIPAAAAWGASAFLGRPAAGRARGALIALNLAAIGFFLLAYSRHGVSFGPYRIDLDVYRIGSRAWLRGANLYGALPPTSSGARLPFSYPPVAAMLLAPLALVPMTVATTALTMATTALTALVLRVFLRSAARSEEGRGTGAGAGLRTPSGAGLRAGLGSWWAVGWLLPAALFLEPVRNTLNYGQINVALMALVTLDCLTAAPRWPRGALVGLAAAVKLTPAAFVLFFLLRRDWPAARAAVGSFAICTGVGFVFGWHDSVRYWTSVVFQTSRPGSPAYAANQSIQGVLARAGLDPHTPAGAAVWLALSALVVVAASRGMGHALARSADAWALSLNAFAALLISPISCSHHWVWGETAMLTLALLGARCRHRGAIALAAVGTAVFAAAPQWWFPAGGDRELLWAGWQQAVGSSYVILAAVVLLLSALRPVVDGVRPQTLPALPPDPVPRPVTGTTPSRLARMTVEASATGKLPPPASSRCRPASAAGEPPSAASCRDGSRTRDSGQPSRCRRVSGSRSRVCSSAGV